MEPYQVLEREWAAWNELDPARMVVCNSGTSALHLALEAMDLPNNTEVLIPDFTFIACARAVTMAGFTPKFMDCGADLLMAMNLLPNGNGVKRLFMPAHIYGRQCNMDRLHYWKWNWGSSPTRIVEDLAEAHGVRPHPNSDAACWSFYKNKIVAGEEGGAVYFKDPAHARTARSLRSHGYRPEVAWSHAAGGYNYRLANALAVPIIQSLRMAKANIEARRQVEALYDAYCPLAWRMPPRHAPWVYDIRIPGLTSETQDALVAKLQAGGVAARHGFKPLSSQEEYRSVETINPNAAAASREVLCLPLTPDVTQKSVRTSFELIREVLNK